MTVHVLRGPSYGPQVQIQDVVIQDVQIDRGRQDFTSAVSSNRASFQLVYDSSAGTLDPTTLELGEFIQIQYFTPAGYNLFGGLITDVAFDKDVARITAVSDGLSRLGRATADFPELYGDVDGALSYYYTNVIVDLYPTGGDPGLISGPYASGSVHIPAATNASPLTVYQTIAASNANSFLFEGLSGQLTYYDSSYFRPATWPAYFPIALNSNEIVDEWQMTKTIGQKTNRASVTYDAGTVVAESTLDVATFGLYETQIATYAYELADAQLIADRQLANFTDPGWQISAITVPVHTLSTVRQNVIVGQIQIGAVIDIPELYTGLPTRYVVQGISDRLGQTLFERTLYLADWELLRPAQTWDDVPAGVDWTDVDPALTWDQMISEWII